MTLSLSLLQENANINVDAWFKLRTAKGEGDLGQIHMKMVYAESSDVKVREGKVCASVNILIWVHCLCRV